MHAKLRENSCSAAILYHLLSDISSEYYEVLI